MLTFKIEFLQLQEHFKAIKTVDQYFKKNFSDFDSFIVPAFRECDSHAGRPKGGLSQCSRMNVNVKKEKIVCKNWRIQAQILHFGSFKLLWINVYFPTDPQTGQFDSAELLATLSDIDGIINNNNFSELLLGGDFNYDRSRSTRFCSLVSDFLVKHGLVSCWEKFNANYTYQHTNLSSFSTIDHFFVSEHFLNNCIDAAPIHLGDNRSNHSPIVLKIQLPTVPEKEQVKTSVPNRPSWSKASSEDIDNYTQLLHDKLQDLSMPDPIVVHFSCFQ